MASLKLSGQLDEAGGRTHVPHPPRQVGGVHRDAVAPIPDRVERLKAEGLGGRRSDDLPDVDTKRFSGVTGAGATLGARVNKLEDQSAERPSVADDNQDLYERVWGEPPPTSGTGEFAVASPPLSFPSENGSAVALEPTLPEAPAAPMRQLTAEPPAGQRSVLVQLQMTETLGRLEAKIAQLQQQVQPFSAANFRESIEAVQGLAKRLTGVAAELEGLIGYGERMVQELADLQAEARRRMPPDPEPPPVPKRRSFR
jgi:hypothetical protein